MFGRGSPKFNAMHKKASPRSGSIKKNGASPKVASPKVPKKGRACWNPGLEKGLVEILLDHNNDYYRGQNGWSLEAWNRVEKEKELKRKYNMLKEARKQSGVSWDDRLGMIQAEPAIWDNIIKSFSKIRKFQTKPFPLFDALGELHDGHTAEGSMNFTSHEAAPSDPSITQNGDDGHIPPYVSLDDEEDDEVSILKPPDQSDVATTSKRAAASNRTKGSVVLDGERKVGKRQKKEATLDKVDKYLDLRAKQIEGEIVVQARAAAEADDFSIKKCISLVNTIEELSGEEKADAFDIFKDAQNREIFMTGEPNARLIWLWKKMVAYLSIGSKPVVDHKRWPHSFLESLIGAHC
ncbi:hypothetical protein U9M48_037541 [Paspalum notatum var. saurae]|uniref:Myb/SANT-like domain-containing protein n=1 Tax=Paspalum notatum var. saurae TaxID=547442 RepID=A0AAQ3UGM4_PASNO